MSAPAPSPLAGKLLDENGEPLYACGASKGARRYQYYISPEQSSKRGRFELEIFV